MDSCSCFSQNCLGPWFYKVTLCERESIFYNFDCGIFVWHTAHHIINSLCSVKNVIGEKIYLQFPLCVLINIKANLQYCLLLRCWKKIRSVLMSLFVLWLFYIRSTFSGTELDFLLKLSRQTKNNPPLERGSSGDGMEERGRKVEEWGEKRWWKRKIKRLRINRNVKSGKSMDATKGFKLARKIR